MCKIDLDAEIQAARERVAGYGELAAPGDVAIVRLADEVAGRSSPAPVGGGVPELTSEEIIAHFRKSLPVGAASADDDEKALEWCFKDSRWGYSLAASRLPALKKGVLSGEEGGATICEKHDFCLEYFRDTDNDWEVAQALMQAKDDGQRMEAKLRENESRIEELESLLMQIGDFAHSRSTGPALPDDLWEVRMMAYEL